MSRAAPPPVLVALLFFASGASGLVYEVVWSRHLQDLFGVSTFAITTVVAAYMAGLALGSGLLGRIADRASAPGCVAGYGLLEIVIGLFAFAFTPLLDTVAGVYRGLSGTLITSMTVRVLCDFLLAFGLLLIPTTLMGGTLPLISRFFTQSAGRTGRGFGWAYALNTFGAVVGVGLTGFVLLHHLGLSTTLYLFGAINLTIGGTAVVIGREHLREFLGALGRKRAETETAEATAPTEAGLSRRLVLLLAAAGGCVSLGCEIAWVRGFASLMLSTTYTFSLVLMVFLVGIALGSAIGSRLKPTPRIVGRIFVLLGACALTQLALYPFWHALMLVTVSGAPEHASLLALQAVMIAVVVFPLTLCSGAALPVLVGVYSHGTGRAGRDVGAVYIANTVGSVLGVAITGFALLPTVGAMTGARLLALLALAGAVAAGVHRTRWWKWGLAAAGIAAVVWPGPSVMRKAYSPVFIGSRFGRAMSFDVAMDPRPSWRTRAFDHGLAANVAVAWDVSEANTTLWINGMPNASTAADQQTQLGLSVLAYLYAARVRDCLHIGLGSGITTGAWAAMPGTDNTRVVELERELWELARHFEPYTLGLHDNASVEFITDDARAHLELLPEASLDVVSSEPSQLWVKGVGNLFTGEFFRLAKQKLRPDGLFVTWIMAYNVPGAVWGIAVATLLDEFEHVFAFAPPSGLGDVIFLCSDRPLQFHQDRWQALQTLQGRADYMLPRLELREPRDLARYALADDAMLRRMVPLALAAGGRSGERNRSDRPVLEFLYPRYVHRSGVENELLTAMTKARFDPARRRFLMPPGLEALQPTDASFHRLCTISGIDPTPYLAGVPSLAELEAALPGLTHPQRTWGFILAVEANRMDLASRFWERIKGARLSADAFDALLRLAEAMHDPAFMRSVLTSLPAPSARTPLPVVERQLDPLRQPPAGNRVTPKAYLDRFLAAFPPRRFMVDQLDYRFLKELVDAAFVMQRVPEIRRYLIEVDDEHGGRCPPVAVALADLLLRQGKVERARERFADYLDTDYTQPYLQAVRARLRALPGN